ncbi:hypothetical protein F5B21DRAFT_484947, partial [Xylaria acuta]
MSNQISDIICLAVAGFNVLSIQAHLTSKFTPGFSKNLAEKLPQHNKAVFWWLGIPDFVLRYVFITFNTLLTVMLGVPSLRAQGLKTAAGLLCVGFYSDMKLGESPIPHLLLISLVGGALWL